MPSEATSEILRRGIEQAPVITIVAAFALAVLWMILRFINAREKQANNIASKCHAVSESAIEAINKNSEVIGTNIEVGREVKGVMEETRRYLVKHNGG